MAKLIISDLPVLEELNYQGLNKIEGGASAGAAAAADSYDATAAAASDTGNYNYTNAYASGGYYGPYSEVTIKPAKRYRPRPRY